MRDAGPEGRQERRARRNGDLARRSGDLSADVLRIAAAIVVDAGAFSLWNLTSRSPARLVRDVTAGAGRPATAMSGAARFIAGLLLLTVGAILLLPLAIQTSTFTVLETWTVLTALLVDQILAGARSKAS